ncbi:hypothetical protein ABIE45_000363 [Methylobacterium sp. OAE515]|uniref:AlbA family DNA-binding domain-containing protein n=1 Tax=Methylobacterium sp. OAE515 TaxID=2817895 RepID=UPI001788F51B
MLDKLYHEIFEMVEKGESDVVEFKLRVPTDAIFAKNILSFANSYGGTLLIGVDGDGALVGIYGPEADIIARRLGRIANGLMPGRCTIQLMPIEGDRAIIVVKVAPPKPGESPIVDPNGRLFVRQGESIILDNAPFTSFVHDAVIPKPKPGKKFVVFVAMSFRSEEEPSLIDYGKAMERAATRSKLEITLTRIDEKEGDYEISQEVMNEIDKADVVLTDYTLSPHNVYFEAGYARGKGKPLIQTARSDTKLEFDVRNWRTLFYRNATELEEALLKAFDSLGSV